MHPDDVRRAVDGLVANTRVALPDTAAIVARSRHRARRRRLAQLGGVAALIVALGVVTVVARANHTTRTTAAHSTPTTSTTTPLPDRSGQVLNMAVVSPFEAWMCTDPLLYTSDGGGTWDTVALPADDPALGTAKNPNSTCAAVMGGNAWVLQPVAGSRTGWPLVRVQNGGRPSLLRFRFGRDGLRPLAMTFVDAEDGWILTIADLTSGLDLPIRSLYRTVDGGRTWTIANENVPATRDLVFTSPTRGWALESSFRLTRTDDGGVSWHDVVLPAAPSGAFLAGVVAKDNAVVVWRGAIVGITTPTFFDVSDDSGQTWARRPGPPRLDLTGATPLAFDAVDAKQWRLYARNLWTTNDGGQSWSEGPRAPLAIIDSVSFTTGQAAWMSGSNGPTQPPELLQTTTAGLRWSDVSQVLPPRVPPEATDREPPAG